jgi:4-amino-4-deoxy-L-arabinose transferase-like glycosyltransferase
MPSSSGQRYHIWLALTLGALLRFEGLGREPFWLDEATTASFAERDLAGAVFAEANHPPLYDVLAWGVAHAIGRGEVHYRALPAIFGVLAILAAWAVARRLAPDSAGVAALLVATSPFLVEFSKENRAYSLFVLVALYATWAWLARRRVHYGVAATLLLYTHYFGVFVLVAHELAERRREGWRWPRALPLLAFAPWAIWAAAHFHAEARAWMGPGWARAPYAFLRFFLGYGLTAVHDDLRSQSIARTLLEEAPLVLPCLALLGWLCVRGARRVENRRLFFFVIVAPYLILVPLSFVHERYLAFQAPFLLILVAAGVRGRVLPQIGCAAVHAIALAAYVIAPARVLGYPFRYGKEDWRAAATFIDAQRPERVVHDPPYLHLALDRYRRPTAPPVPGRVAIVQSHTTAPLPPGTGPSLHLPAHSGIRIRILEQGTGNRQPATENGI